MKADEFNKKYNAYLETGYYGLAINNEEFIDWLDVKFQEFIKKPEFSYSQIKTKYGVGRFYCTGLTIEEKQEVENKITNSVSNNNNK